MTAGCEHEPLCCELQNEMDWRRNLEALLPPRRRCCICTRYMPWEPLRSHSVCGREFSAAWVSVPFRYLGTSGPDDPTQAAQDSLVLLGLLGLSVHRQARAWRCRDMYRHIRAPENPSMRGGGQRQRKRLQRKWGSREIDFQGRPWQWPGRRNGDGSCSRKIRTHSAKCAAQKSGCTRRAACLHLAGV